MNSIIVTHFDFDAPECGTSVLDAALDRLGAFLDAEHDTLGRVLAQAGRRPATGVLDRLAQLHLAPDSTAEALRELLEEALVCLEILLETLREIPTNCALQTAWGLPGPASFDTHVRWSGARLEDIVATLRHALAA